MQYLLDANAVISLLNDKNSKLAKRMRQHKPADVHISSIVAFELYYGAFKSSRSVHNLALIDGLQFEILDFDMQDSRHAGEVRASLSAKGTPIGPYDVLIAGQARARGMTLVTHNTQEFKRVPGLKVEDWQ